MSLFTALFITVYVHVLYCAIWSYDHNIEEILLLSLIIQEIAQIVLFFFSIPETCLLRTAVFNSRPRNELRSERHRGEKRKKTLSNESRAYGEERRPVFIRATRAARGVSSPTI